MKRPTRLLLLVLGLTAAACSTSTSDTTNPDEPPQATTVTVTTAGASNTAQPGTTTAPPLPEAQPHWIRIEGNSFADTRTGTPFVPRGVNLILKTGGGGGDQLFARYDADWVEEQLDQIVALDLNTVRFFLDQCRPCTSSADGLRPEYLDDLADLLVRLEAHGLVALPTSNDVPDLGFSDRLPCCELFGGYRNSLYLSAEGHAIASEYWSELIESIEARGAPTHHVLGWQLTNEQFVLRDVPPLSLSEGIATAADGISYDLADDAQVEAMVINNLLAYISTVGAAVRRADEGALVTMGFFPSDEPGAGRTARDNRWVVPQHVVHASTLDFIDLHAYPGLGGTWDILGPAFGITETSPTIPLVLGEFGAFEVAYRDIDEAAAAMARWQAASCELGFQGWLLWFWGANKDDEVYPVNIGDAAIARATSPSVRPDPCDVGPYANENLALGMAVTASAEESDEYAAANVVDGSDATWWSAANGPPQWVEIDLGADVTVGSVEIFIGFVTPPGPQTHLVSLRNDVGEVMASRSVSADAGPGDVLIGDFDSVMTVRYVRVDTVAMDGWVILHEIRVLADEAG